MVINDPIDYSLSIKHIKTIICVSDNENAEKLKKLIIYIEARPFTIKVFNFIPLNADLVGIVLNLGVTYFIILIQMTHIY